MPGSYLNLHDNNIFVMLKPGHYDLLYHCEFLEYAEDIELPDKELVALFNGIAKGNKEKQMILARCKHSFSASTLK